MHRLERPGTSCVRYDKEGNTVTVIDGASGKTRAKIVKTAPGNAEKLAPPCAMLSLSVMNA